MVQQQYGRLEINFSLKKPKTPYKTLAVQECFYSAGPLSTETTEIHRVSVESLSMYSVAALLEHIFYVKVTHKKPKFQLFLIQTALLW